MRVGVEGATSGAQILNDLIGANPVITVELPIV